ncbi:MAG: TrkH family potassium uptake protein [Pseudomonadota bacterium]
MHDFAPVGQVIGRLSIVLGASMLLPALVDLIDGSENWLAFVLSGFLTLAGGQALIFANSGGERRGLKRPQAFLLTTIVWVILPLFGCLPFIIGAPGVGFTDAYFEAMSGLTTTGSTVFSALDEAPRGMLLWRALLQWYGGVGIIVVAIVFLPVLKIGGMQFFRSESFDLGGDILPRATAIAGQLAWIYIALTVACMLSYSAAGMSAFDALCHAMTTLATGGLANYDDSFASFDPVVHYVAVIFMWAAALPFLNFIQITRGRARPLLTDPQVQAFLGIIAVTAAVLVTWQVAADDRDFEPALRAALFNVTSVITGTGYATEDYGAWGGMPAGIFFILALIGGCTGSTSCSAKVFRYQVLFAALSVQIRRIHSPHGVYPLRYQGRPIEPEVVSSIMGFFFVFFTALSVWTILLSMIGLDTLTAISGSVSALANLGPGLGPVIGPTGNFAGLPDVAKWLLALGMVLGRLEFLSVMVLFMPSFWQR